MIDEGTQHNAEIAEQKYGIPKEVYLELSEIFAISKSFELIMNAPAPVKMKIGTAFAYGLIIGWLKKGGQDEVIQEVLATENQS